ncbi:MAG: hypothetical protein P8L68_03230 [Paracoccaceae bacterium]|nr:hypothetical protein [Paracoccaceae bacterium]MDG1737542.1 hypothetical protein [Paracoccaceae bacterium]MDG2257488.1 hypothetical protein [Paracoccaceae bacterium]
MKIKALVAIVATLFAFAFTPVYADSHGDDVKRLAIQVSDNNEGTMTKVLNVAANFAKGMLESGQEYEIEIVSFNAGLHMLREDTSPVLERIQGFTNSVPNVTLSACGNTIAGMTRKAGGKAPVLITDAHIVPAGVVRLMELDAAGWFVIRP